MKKTESAMTIKKVAGLAGVGVETVRFYERESLILKAPRTAAGYRQYTAETVSRIQFIKRAQNLGFSLSEIKGLLLLRISKETKREDLRKKTTEKIRIIEEKIQALQQIKKTLTQLTDSCHGNGRLDQCPILKALEQGGRSK